MPDHAPPHVPELAVPAEETRCDHHVRIQACPSWAEAIALAAETYRTWVVGTVLEPETYRMWVVEIGRGPEIGQIREIAPVLEHDRLQAIDPTGEDLPQVNWATSSASTNRFAPMAAGGQRPFPVRLVIDPGPPIVQALVIDPEQEIVLALAIDRESQIDRVLEIVRESILDPGLAIARISTIDRVGPTTG